MLGGVVKPGEANVGLQLIAAKDAIDIQALEADISGRLIELLKTGRVRLVIID